MRRLRAIVRASLVLGVTAVCYSIFVLGRLSRLAGAGHGWRNGWFRRWARAVCRLIGIRTRGVGTPPQDALIVSNHVSYIDIILIASYVDAVFVAKAEVADWPFIGTVCKGIDTIFIDRQSKRDVVAVGEEMEKRLASGLGVVVFPEGTSSNGEAVLPFKPSLLEVAARDAVPVHYATVHYSVPDGEPPATDSVAWWGDMEFAPHVWDLMKLREVSAEVMFGDEPIVDRDRKQLAAKLQKAVEHQLAAMS